MARLRPMPAIALPQASLAQFGALFVQNGNKLARTVSQQLTNVIDQEVASALAVMLGNIPVRGAQRGKIWPPDADCVETAPATVVGAVRTQNSTLSTAPTACASRSTARRSTTRRAWPRTTRT
jgi:hypothetical protein